MITLEVKMPFRPQISRMNLVKVAENILKEIDLLPDTEISIQIDNDQALQKLNKRFLGYDQPTDVLSFESNEIDPETGRFHLGDIVISFESAERQAQEAGHPLENEMILLLTHGILHLSGMDHSSKEEKFDMWNKQQTILDHMGVKINRIVGDQDFHD